MEEEQDIRLIVKGGKQGVQIDVQKFPILCPSCNHYLPELFEHKISRYGHVGSIACNCGEVLNLTDSDNIVEYINIHTRDTKITIDFKKFFKLEKEDFNFLKSKFNYDIFKVHANKRIWLSELIKDLEEIIGDIIQPKTTGFPASRNQKKWLAIASLRK